MNNKEIIRNGMFMALLLVISIGIVSQNVQASGVSSPYWDESAGPEVSPLVMSPGETKDFHFTLSNTDGSEDVTFRANINKGSEVLTITDSNTNYFVEAGKGGVFVNVRASIPASVSVGTSYPIEVEFTSSPQAPSGQLQFGSGFIKSFEVIVQEKVIAPTPAPTPTPETPTTPETPATPPTPTPTEGTPTIIYVLIALIIIAIIIIIIKSRKKKSK